MEIIFSKLKYLETLPSSQNIGSPCVIFKDLGRAIAGRVSWLDLNTQIL